MNNIDEAKLFSALLAVLKKSESTLRKEIFEELLAEMPYASAGPQGEEGPQGPKGDIGPQGLRGDIGPQGPQGLKGDKGDKGDTGEIGPEGKEGPIGLQGETGEQGQKGDKGDKGDQGDIGLTGLKGDKGDQGITGATGPTGSIGPKGDKGERGPIGTAGRDGTDGLLGPEGKTGPAGPKGESGSQGLIGPQGLKGDTGPAGPQGIQGEPGIPGKDGKDGETPDIKPVIEDVELFKAQIRQAMKAGGATGAITGSGEVRLEFLDDVDRTTAKVDGNFLQYNAASGKWIGAAGSLSSNGNASSANVDLTAISSNIIPTANNVYDIGTPTMRWREMYLSGNTINLGGATISSDGTGTLQISGAGAVLPAGSKVGTATVASIATTGSLAEAIPFYTQASGLNVVANTFYFSADVSTVNKTFRNYYFENGQQITWSDKIAQFLF